MKRNEIITHITQRSPINHKHKPACAISIVRAHDRSYTGIEASKGERSLRFPRRGPVEGPNSRVTIQDAPTLREELLESAHHLLIYGPRRFATSAYDNYVIIPTDEVCAVTDGCNIISQRSHRTRTANAPTAVSSLSPVATHTLIPARFKSAIVSGTPSWRLSSIAVAPSNRKSRSISSETDSISSSRFSSAIVASWYRSFHDAYSSSAQKSVHQHAKR